MVNLWAYRNLIALPIVVLIISGCGPSGFSNEDIANVKSSIKQEFEKKGGLEVVDVQMIKETPTKLKGFAKLKTKGFLGISQEITKSCSATMGEDAQFIWQCD